MTDPVRPLPSISVVIPTYNRPEVLARTVRHLLTQDYPMDRVEILLVDNSSQQNQAILAALVAGTGAPVWLVASRNRLPAIKRNEGLDLATGDLVLFMNDDVWAEPCLFAQHAASHLAAPEPTAVLGHVEQSPEMPQTPFIEAYTPFAYSQLTGRAGERLEYRYFWSMNLSLPREALLAKGLRFQEAWNEIGHEDIELGYRWAASGGHIVYNPRAAGWHYHPHSLDSACKLQEVIGRGLKDLEVLIPEPDLLEHYGIFSWSNSPRSVVRGLVRRSLFNTLTAGPAKRWLEQRSTNSPLTRWMYWKVLLHYTNRGYRTGPPPVATRPPAPVPASQERTGR